MTEMQRRWKAASQADYVLQVETVFQKTVIQELTIVLGKEIHLPEAVLRFVERVIQKIGIPKSRIVLAGVQHQKVGIVTLMIVPFVMGSHLSSCPVLHFSVVQTGVKYLIIRVSQPTVALFPV
jgi:hypothetical protein